MTTLLLTACLSCQRSLGNGTCTAFPKGIPEDIWTGIADHRTSRDGEPTYLADPGKSLDAEAWKAKAEQLDTLDLDALASMPFHLPGKHDQKTHGSGGTSWPGDWGGVSLEEARALTYQHYQQMFKVLNLGSDPDRPAIDKATTGYTFYQSGDNLVGIHADADINDTDTAKLMENVDTLSERFPVPGGVNVMVDTIDAMNPSDWRKIDGGMDPNLAETVKATGMMRFSDMGLNGGAESHLTELYRGDQATSLIAHEWGHTQDTIDTFASRQVKKDLRSAGVGNSSRYALVGGPDEAFAEAFADFNTTPSGGTHAWSSTQAYVDTYGWK